MKIELWKTPDVKPYPNNPRLNDEAVDAVVASIREFGFRQPIVVDSDGVIIVGHTRWKAAQKLGLEKVPVHVAKDLTAGADQGVSHRRQQDERVGRMEFRSAADRTGRPPGARTTTSAYSGFDQDELAKLLNGDLRRRPVRSGRGARPRPTKRRRSRATCGFSATTVCSAATAASPRTWIACSTARRSIWSTPTRRTT